MQASEIALIDGRRLEINYSDQGTQLASSANMAKLNAESITISCSGRRRSVDNIFVERLQRQTNHAVDIATRNKREQSIVLLKI